MQRALAEKWVQGVSPADCTVDVAVRTMEGRLGAVLHFLPLAAERADEDTEHVHQLRVWTRRATAAVGLYEDLLPRRRGSWLKKQLKRVRRAANDARDCDVLIGRLSKRSSGRGTNRWLEATQAERAEAQKSIVAVYERLVHDDRFSRRICKLLDRVRSRGEESAGEIEPFGAWAHSHLRPMVEQFFAAVPSDHADEVGLHRFRVCGKHLRYAIELLAAAFPEQLRTEFYPAIEALQDQLGEINDLATAKARLVRKCDEASDAKEAAAWRRLLTAEQVRLDHARQQFWKGCSPQWIRDLHDGFERMIDETAPSGADLDRPAPSAPTAVTRADGNVAPRSDGQSVPPGGATHKARIVGELGEEKIAPAGPGQRRARRQ
jgi:CHAD domain-containing protein